MVGIASHADATAVVVRMKAGAQNRGKGLGVASDRSWQQRPWRNSINSQSGLLTFFVFETLYGLGAARDPFLDKLDLRTRLRPANPGLSFLCKAA